MNVFERQDRMEQLRWLLDRGWLAAQMFRGDELLPVVASIQAQLVRPHAAFERGLRDEMVALVVVGAVWRDDIAEARRWARETHGAHKLSRFRSTLRTAMRYVAWRLRDPCAFYALSTPRLGRLSEPAIAARIANLAMEGAAEAEQLRFKAAERLSKDALKLFAERGGVHGNTLLLPTCVLATLAFESGSVDEADVLIRGKIADLERYGSMESTLWGFAVAGRVAVARGKINVVLLLLERGEGLGVRRRWPRLATRCALDRIALQLGLGAGASAHRTLERAEQWLGTLGPDVPHFPFDRWPLELARCRVLLFDGYPDAAARLARTWRDQAVQCNHPYVVVRFALIVVGALFAMDDIEAAKRELLAALRQGAGTGLFRTFCDDAWMIEPCLRLVRREDRAALGRLTVFIDSVLDAGRSGGLSVRRRVPARGIAEPLTEGETVVLRLMSLGLSPPRRSISCATSPSIPAGC
ncbi:hypothetical protein [Luteibacter sp. UNC138MFCol5.1]|uniref:hypothetical protein n=1 Tax=Luteibacter sp. UNC138MFCol5.1 TaxID=1502774 RepID=UPI000B7D4058|nr:hypothetical protein [Luteibacter sp. UNC138MFCol5.1]